MTGRADTSLTPGQKGPVLLGISIDARTDTPQVARCEQAEREFLAGVAPRHAAFTRHATARLAAGEETYGDSWARRGVRELLVELLEEAADVGAWAALAVQSLDELDERQRERVAALLTLAAGYGARAHESLTAALGQLGEERSS